MEIFWLIFMNMYKDYIQDLSTTMQHFVRKIKFKISKCFCTKIRDYLTYFKLKSLKSKKL